MKTVFVLAALLAVALADHQQWAYSADINYGRTWNFPTLTSTTCTPQNATLDRFVSFNLTFAQSTVIEVVAMFENGWLDNNALVLVYSGNFDVAAANFNVCNTFTYINDLSGVPPIRYIVEFPAGTYTFVVSGDGTTYTTRRFTMQLTAADWTGNTNETVSGGNTTLNTNTWQAPYSSTDTCGTLSGYYTPYSTLRWTPTVTQAYDIEVQFLDGNQYAVIAVYNGVFPNTTGPATACDGNLIFAVVSGSRNGYAGIASLNAVAGNNYTIVVSGWYAYESGRFAFLSRKSIYGDTASANATFLKPTIPPVGITTNCSAGSTMAKWFAHTFTAQYPIYIVDTDANYDAAAVLYLGIGNNTVPPSPCSGFIIAGDTGDGGPLVAYTTPGQNYTIIVTAYGTASGSYNLWAIGGVGLALPPAPSTTGLVPTPTTGGSGGNSGVATTGSSGGNSGTPTTGAVSGGNTGASTTSQEDSFASALAPLFGLIALFALMF